MWLSFTWICEACEKLASCSWGRLRGDDSGLVPIEVRQAHREPTGEQRMKFQESGPGLVKQDIIAEVADLAQQNADVIGRPVVSALLDHRGTERPFASPCLRVRDKQIVANCRADRVGLLPTVGFKFGQWVDSVMVQRALGPGDTTLPGLWPETPPATADRG